METFAKNFDDAVETLAEDSAKISGRSSRMKRRVEMILEEIHGVQMKLSQQRDLFFLHFEFQKV